MFRRLGLLCATLAVLSLAGGHWAALQTVAKATMLYHYTQRSGSLAVAAEETFDGRHPCQFCREIATAKSCEQKQSSGVPALKQEAKAKAVLADDSLCPTERFAVEILLPRVSTRPGLTRGEQPPTPPPRSVDFAV